MGQVSLSVDAQNEKAVAQFVDDKGDITQTGPNGPDGQPATIAYASSDPTVLDVAQDGSLTLNKAGTATVTATAVDDTGAPIAGFAAASVDVELTPGAAAGLEVNVQP